MSKSQSSKGRVGNAPAGEMSLTARKEKMIKDLKEGQTSQSISFSESSTVALPRQVKAPTDRRAEQAVTPLSNLTARASSLATQVIGEKLRAAVLLKELLALQDATEMVADLIDVPFEPVIPEMTRENITDWADTTRLIAAVRKITPIMEAAADVLADHASTFESAASQLQILSNVVTTSAVDADDLMSVINDAHT